MAERIDVAVIGAGQAGLAASCELTRAGVEHVVLERGKVAQTWRGRWDSFCLVTPNWTIRLPDGHYDGDDPDGYLPRDELVSFFDRYADGIGAPVREGVDVTLLRPTSSGFELRTGNGTIAARSVVVASGAYQRPHRPPAMTGLSADIHQLDVTGYTDPSALPPGPVLVLGSGQSGCQIAEELCEAGREVFLSCGRAPWIPRRLGDRDIVWWVIATGFLDQPVSALPDPEARLWANLLSTGHGGGHTLNLRTLRGIGVTLLGHVVGIDGTRARFAADLAESQAWGDARYGDLMELVRTHVREHGLAMPEILDPEPFDGTAPTELDLTGFGAVIVTGGFRPDYGWVDVAGAFDLQGFPNHEDCMSTAAPGLAFVGVHFLRTRKSSLLYGVGEDAAVAAHGVAAHLGARLDGASGS
jgi:putative flavoprotein involved in K+ transport